MLSLLTVLPVLLLTSRAQAWGAVGHEAVGYVAMGFLSEGALDFVKTSLGSEFNQSLGVAATWADNIKSNDEYDWASPLHYVDAEDEPPTECSVEQSRDCADGNCILTAIANYTMRVIDESLDDDQHQEALKFLDHFIGDLGQPLHVEAFEIGGNDVDVKCEGNTKNLHSVWDSGIVNVIVDDGYSGSSSDWADSLIEKIKTGTYANSASDWISCSSIDEADKCVLKWAADSNIINCDFLFTYTNFDDLCTGDYYNSAVPIIEEQIAKQGYRLAAWLNVLFDGSTGL